MDYCKAYPVPKLPNSSYYYSSVLIFNLFNIDIHKSDKSYMFYFLEGVFKRGPNSVFSFLFKVINENITKNIKTIYIFSDSYGAQNKNYTVFKFLTWLSIYFKVKITQVFPVRGHSYCVCDRNFVILSKSIKNLAIIETPEDYIKEFQNFNFIIEKGVS